MCRAAPNLIELHAPRDIHTSDEAIAASSPQPVQAWKSALFLAQGLLFLPRKDGHVTSRG